MPFSVGIIYSSQTLLGILSADTITFDQFPRMFQRIDVASAPGVLAIAQRCNWVAVDHSGHLVLTERGRAIRTLADPLLTLREQLADLVCALQPPWARRIHLGRQETRRSVPRHIEQCFSEGELFDGLDDPTITWWDRLSSQLRSFRSGFLLEIGRNAERRTIAFERRRTGREPLWQSIESNVSGFDILSIVERTAPHPLKIEVKGSAMREREATFVLTRNEWETARRSHHYCFHLWLIQGDPQLFIVPHLQIAPYVPTDSRTGRWETATLRFRDFRDYKVVFDAPDVSF